MKLPYRTPKQFSKPKHVKNNDVLELPMAQFLSFNNVNFVRQYKPIPKRLYRCDFYLPDYNVIIEIEGGQWIHGRHQRGYGMQKDIEKYNLLTLLGYRLLRLTTDHFMKVGNNQYAVNGYSAQLIKDIATTWSKKNG